ncbi:hypothetical protein PR048_006490 [Dryococelus australis]|uniref:Uncharacterized protein n=1 Tax=Dryococelus australis TaxID=614101 RepID=A0ABQ9ICB3_9NEOP|nr:hypothetical protein PR048_006490 [Dryococelus australis]
MVKKRRSNTGDTNTHAYCLIAPTRKTRSVSVQKVLKIVLWPRVDTRTEKKFRGGTHDYQALMGEQHVAKDCSRCFAHSGDAALDARASVALSVRSPLCHVASGAVGRKVLKGQDYLYVDSRLSTYSYLYFQEASAAAAVACFSRTNLTVYFSPWRADTGPAGRAPGGPSRQRLTRSRCSAASRGSFPSLVKCSRAANHSLLALSSHFSNQTVKKEKITPCVTLGIVPDDAAGRRVFSGISRFPPTLSFRRCSTLTSIALIGSQGLAVKSRRNLFTHSCVTRMVVFCVQLQTPTIYGGGSVTNRSFGNNTSCFFKSWGACRSSTLTGEWVRIMVLFHGRPMRYPLPHLAVETVLKRGTSRKGSSLESYSAQQLVDDTVENQFVTEDKPQTVHSDDLYVTTVTNSKINCTTSFSLARHFAL